MEYFVFLPRHIVQIMFNGPRTVWRCGAKKLKTEVQKR